MNIRLSFNFVLYIWNLNIARFIIILTISIKVL